MCKLLLVLYVIKFNACLKMYLGPGIVLVSDVSPLQFFKYIYINIYIYIYIYIFFLNTASLDTIEENIALVLWNIT